MMGIGLFVQLLGNVLYSSGSMNGVHVYFLLILPALLLTILLGVKKTQLLDQGGRFFLLMAGGFLLFSSVSAAWSNGEDCVLYVLRKSVVIILYLVGVIYLASIASARAIKWFLVSGCVIAALGAFISMSYQLTVLGETFGWRTFRISRMGYGEWIDLGYPVIAGIYFGLFAVLAASLIAIRGQRDNVMWGLAVSILLLLPYMFLTFSRTSWIAMAVSVGYLLLAFRNRASMAIACCMGIIALIIMVFYYGDVVVEVTERQLSGRTEIWRWAIHSIMEKPVFGHGFAHSFWEENSAVPHAHNFYLQVLFEQGIVGFISFLAMLCVVVHAAWKNKEDSLVVGAFALVVYIMTVMLVEIQHVITRPGLYWTIFWFPLALVVGLANRNSFLDLSVRKEKRAD
jgi:hypothetical protein